MPEQYFFWLGADAYNMDYSEHLLEGAFECMVVEQDQDYE